MTRQVLQFKPWKVVQADASDLPADSLYAKDVWNIQELGGQGLNIAQQYGHYKLTFTRIVQPWLKTAAKKFLRYSLATSAFTTCTNRVEAVKRLSEFLIQVYPSLKPAEFNREVVLDYLSFLAEYKIRKGKAHSGSPLSPRTRQADIYTLRLFIDNCCRNHWLDFPSHPIIYPEDLPPRVRSNPKFIPREVLEQLNQHLDCLPDPYMRMVLVLQEVGMRISELCTLKFDCLSQDASGDWWLHYYQHKMKKDHTVVIPRELVSVIQEQQQFIREHLGSEYSYLFCSRTVAGKRVALRHTLAKDFVPVPKPPGSSTLNHALNVLADLKDIRSASGDRWHFHCHQFRHTVGTSMANRGVPIHIIARYLGHETLQMTMTYTHIHDQTLKDAIAKIQGRIVDVTGKVVEVRTDLDTGDLQWFKRHVHAQALPNGSCALPAPQQQCPHANACLTCTHFRTTVEFLDQHKEQLAQTEQILEKAKANNWVRQVEMNERVAENLQKIVNSLEEQAS